MSACETAAALQRLLEVHFPDARGRYRVDSAGPDGAVVRLQPGRHDLRPGGTVSGPALMELADTAMWMAVMGASAERLEMGAAQLDAVTSDLSIHFLRRAPAGPVVACCQLLKRGRRLAVGDVRLYAVPADHGGDPLVAPLEALGAPVAQATVSYALAGP